VLGDRCGLSQPWPPYYGGGTLEIIKNIWEVERVNYKEEKAVASIVANCNNSEVTEFNQ
jgi:hypothetical protein